jgi:hypothetical protein
MCTNKKVENFSLCFATIIKQNVSEFGRKLSKLQKAVYVFQRKKYIMDCDIFIGSAVNDMEFLLDSSFGRYSIEKD